MATALKGVNASASGLVVAAALILGQSYATSLPEQVASLTGPIPGYRLPAILTRPIPGCRTADTMGTAYYGHMATACYGHTYDSHAVARLTMAALSTAAPSASPLAARAGARHALLLRHHLLRRAPGAHRAP